MSNKIIIICDRVIEYSLYFLIFFLPFSKAGLQSFTWCAILAWVIKKIVNKKRKEKKSSLIERINILILFFAISCILSTLLSLDFSLSLKALITKVGKQLLIFFIIIETINNNKKIRNILLVFLISSVLIAADTGVQYFTGKDFLRGYESQGNRLQASFSTPVGFSGWLITLIPLLLVLIFSKIFFRRIILKIGFLLLLFLLIFYLGLTYTRSSWLGFILSLILISYFILKNIEKNSKAFAYFLVTLILFNIIIYLPQSIKQRFFSIPIIQGNILLRINLWKDCLALISDFPIFGIGLNSYSKIITFYKSMKANLYPHNSYMQILSEIGIIGLLSFLSLIWKVFRIGLKTIYETNDKLLLGLLACLSASLVQSFFDVNLYALQLATLFWFILGLTVARIRILTEDNGILA